MPEALLILILSSNFEPRLDQKFTMECPCRDLWCRATLYGHVFGYIPWTNCGCSAKGYNLKVWGMKSFRRQALML